MVKKYLTRLLSASGLPFLWRRSHRNDPTIVMYHGVIKDEDWRDWETADMVTRSAFREHLAFYQQHYTVVSLKSVADHLTGILPCLPPYPLVITFDDGYRNNLRWAVPVLKEFGLVATFFVTTGFVDGTADLWWLALKRRFIEAQQHNRSVALQGIPAFCVHSRLEAGEGYQRAVAILKSLPAGRRHEALCGLASAEQQPGAGWLNGIYEPLNWSELREMQKDGMEIGAHTVTHAILSQEPPTEARREIFASVEKVKAELARENVPFSYPNGERKDFTAEHERLVREAGAYAAAARFVGRNETPDVLYALRRFCVAGHHTLAGLNVEVCGLRSFINARLLRLLPGQ